MPSPMPDEQLEALFLACAPPGVRLDGGALAGALRKLVDAGREAWPSVALPPEAFVRYLAARGMLDAAHPADLYLACACAERAPGAVEAFEAAYMGRVGGYLVKMRPTRPFLDDVRQTLREKLLVGRDGAPPRIAEYDGRGALASWLRVVAVRTAVDLHRATDHDEEPADDDRVLPGAVTDPEVGYVKQRYRGAFNDAVRDAFEALDDEQREVLRSHFVEGRTLEEVAAALGVSRATAARRLAAARKAVMDEARSLLGARLGARGAALESLAGVMVSQIDLSLPGLLKRREG